MPLTMAARVCARPACGQPFTVRACQIARGRGIYCSRRCLSVMNAATTHQRHSWVGEANPNFKDWRSRDKSAYKDRFRARYPEKAQAHDAVEAALRSGRLVRPATCQRCAGRGVEALHAHHEDYAKPLAVIFVCRACHRILDAARRARLGHVRGPVVTPASRIHIPPGVAALGPSASEARESVRSRS